MAAHMVSIARREYANDWSWRKGSGAAASAAADGSQAAARTGAPRAGGEGREASEGQAGPAPGAAHRGGERAATAVLEAPPAAAASGGAPGPDAQAALSGDPVEPKRVLYSYYTVQARLPLCTVGLVDLWQCALALPGSPGGQFQAWEPLCTAGAHLSAAAGPLLSRLAPRRPSGVAMLASPARSPDTARGCDGDCALLAPTRRSPRCCASAVRRQARAAWGPPSWRPACCWRARRPPRTSTTRRRAVLAASCGTCRRPLPLRVSALVRIMISLSRSEAVAMGVAHSFAQQF